MKREQKIKFRVFSKLENKYLPSYADRGLSFYTNYGREMDPYYWAGVDWFISAELHENPINYVVEQYIGQKDEKGREIYVGDVVKNINGLYLVKEFGKIETLKENFAPNLSIMGYIFYDEVIGNVNKNPALLKI